MVYVNVEMNSACIWPSTILTTILLANIERSHTFKGSRHLNMIRRNPEYNDSPQRSGARYEYCGVKAWNVSQKGQSSAITGYGWYRTSIA